MSGVGEADRTRADEDPERVVQTEAGEGAVSVRVRRVARHAVVRTKVIECGCFLDPEGR